MPTIGLKKSTVKKPAARKAAAKKTTSKKRTAKRYEVVGTTRDGVRILRGAAEPTHFTSEEIRDTIREILKRS